MCLGLRRYDEWSSVPSGLVGGGRGGREGYNTLPSAIFGDYWSTRLAYPGYLLPNSLESWLNMCLGLRRYDDVRSPGGSMGGGGGESSCPMGTSRSARCGRGGSKLVPCAKPGKCAVVSG
ncbi:hypothetical protein HNY73_018911 [Argiope bruennichi]|uniref:Uncharacterized protein n=1 Tax=Argiope bruennichi TaxID=94029 RepID=A0A8T0EEQ9_ARGBR|nr:hypothetical protein HNY73_018911 [Argiope bruennichi]